MLKDDRLGRLLLSRSRIVVDAGPRAALLLVLIHHCLSCKKLYRVYIVIVFIYTTFNKYSVSISAIRMYTVNGELTVHL